MVLIPTSPPSSAKQPRLHHQIVQIQKLKSPRSASISTSTSSSWFGGQSNAGTSTPTKASTPSKMCREEQQHYQHHQHVVVAAQSQKNPLVMVAMLFFGLLMALLIMAFFTVAPLLCASCIGLCYVIMLFLSTERKWRWHDAQEFENRFWSITAFLFSTALFYIQDSPFAIGRYNSSLGMIGVCLVTMFVHFMDRVKHRRAISRKPRLNERDASLYQNLFKYKATAEEKAKLLNECVARIDRHYLPSTINNVINFGVVKRQEQKIFRILAGASKDELNYILNHVRLALVFYKVKDHSRLRSDQCRTQVLDLLCITRLADLTVTSRAFLLDALMVMKISAHPRGEKWVRNILLKTSGDDLSQLKSVTDAKGDFHSLHKLVFHDIRNPAMRNDILNHIRREAGVQTAHMRLGTRKSMKRRMLAWRKVLSDVDDTLYSSGGRYPAGIDVRFPRHTVYPGVLSFYRELDMGTAGKDDWNDAERSVGNLVFLSARPHVYKDVSEKKSYEKFTSLYEKKGMHTLPTLLAGSLESGRAFMVQGNLEPMATKKFENFCEYYQLYPEFKHVFIGDNGQGDVRAAEMIMEKFRSNDVLEAGFFHLVQPIEKTFGYQSPETLAKWKAMNLVFFNSYAGAAVEAYKLKLIRISGLYKICVEAKTNFCAISSWTKANDRENARLILNTDLMNANELLRKAKYPERIGLITKPQMFELQATVSTPFGKGVVRKYRGVDGIYQVELVDWPRTSKNVSKTYGFYTQENLEIYVEPASNKAPTINNSPTSKNKKQQHLWAHVRFYKGLPANPLGVVTHRQVDTPFGKGRIMDYRASDDTYQVQLDGKNDKVVAFLRKNFVVIDDKDGNSSPRIFSGVRGFFTKRFGLGAGEASSSKNSSPTSNTTGLFATGTTVDSPFGKGLVLRFRSSDRVYELHLLNLPLHESTVVFVHEHFLKLSPVTPGSRSLLSSLLGLSGSEAKASSSTGALLDIGTKVQTPFGDAIIEKYRKESEVYELKMASTNKTGSHPQAVAYVHRRFLENTGSTMDDMPLLTLSKRLVSHGSSSGMNFFQFLFTSTPPNSSAKHQRTPNKLPYENEPNVNRVVKTPFGIGRTHMSKPHHGAVKVCFGNETQICGAVGFVQESHVQELREGLRRRNTYELLETTYKYLRSNWGSNNNTSSAAAANPVANDAEEEAKALAKVKFPKGTLVRTFFGEGIVCQVRAREEVYQVRFAGDVEGFFHGSSLKRSVRGVLGMPVNTLFGTGLLVEVRETDGIHVVNLRQRVSSENQTALLGCAQAASQCFREVQSFLQPSCVKGLIKAALGDLVRTPYGNGIVLKYREQDKVFVVALDWNTSACQSYWYQATPAALSKGSAGSPKDPIASKKLCFVTAHLREEDVARIHQPVEKASSGCYVM